MGWETPVTCGAPASGVSCGEAEQGGQRFVKRRLHHDLVSCRCDDSLELREIGALGLEIQRNHVKERILDRNHNELSANYARSLLIPERELLRNGRVLVDHRRNLIRPIGQLVFRQFVEKHFPVIREVGPRRQPGDHIVPVLRRERTHEQVLQLIASGKLHQDVIGIHGTYFAVELLLRRHPQIFAVVEDLRVGHVECLVLRRLNGEEILRVAQVRFKIGGKLIQVLKHTGKRLPINIEYGIRGNP